LKLRNVHLAEMRPWNEILLSNAMALQLSWLPSVSCRSSLWSVPKCKIKHSGHLQSCFSHLVLPWASSQVIVHGEGRDEAVGTAVKGDLLGRGGGWPGL